jgi:hypothetical protein
MSAADDRIEIIPPGARSRRGRLARHDARAPIVDTAGLVPGIGDAVTTAVSLWIVYEAHQLGAHKHVVARMLGNVALDGVVGAVPLVGDAFDVAWRANRRNIRILREHLARRGLD